MFSYAFRGFSCKHMQIKNICVSVVLFCLLTYIKGTHSCSIPFFSLNLSWKSFQITIRRASSFCFFFFNSRMEIPLCDSSTVYLTIPYWKTLGLFPDFSHKKIKLQWISLYTVSFCMCVSTSGGFRPLQLFKRTYWYIT